MMMKSGSVRVAKFGKVNVTPIRGGRFHYGPDWSHCKTQSDAIKAAREWCMARGIDDATHTLKVYGKTGKPTGDTVFIVPDQD